MGRRLNEREARQAVVQGVTAVLDLTAEFSEPAAFRTLSYLNLPVQDLTAPGPEDLAAAFAFIERERTRGIVYVHCKIGYSRSAAVVGAYLCAAGVAPDPADAIARMRRARPSLVVRPEARTAMASWPENSAAEAIQDPIHLLPYRCDRVPYDGKTPAAGGRASE
jgi:protein-tyrosine phosphatase